MARQTVNTGSAANDNTGDTMRNAGTKINANFTEIYTILGDGTTGATKIKFSDQGIIAEGASANDFETTLGFTDPTADRTITFPDATGTVQLTGGTQSLTSAVLTTPQIQDTSSNHQYIFAPSELAADRTVTLPLLAGNDQFTFNAHTETLTNKTLTSPVLTAPKFADAGFIADANGNEQIVFQTTASAVNHIELTNAATGGAAAINAVGGDAAVSLAIAAKGIGSLSLSSKLNYQTETLTGTTVAASAVIPLTVHNAGSAVACSLINGTVAGQIKKFVNINSGAVTITPATYGQGTTIILAQHETASLVWSGSSWYSIGGDAPKFLGLTAGATAASKVVTTDANGDFLMPDGDKARLGAGGDMTLFHDGTNSFLTNATGIMKIATENSGIAVTIGHTTSETTVADNLSVTGNATVGGILTGLTVEATGDTAAGDNAAIGYTAAEGLILTGQGSQNDVTIKNDADADVIEIPTGTTNVNVVGHLTPGTLNTGIVVLVATGAITQAAHAGKTLSMAEVGGDAACTFTLPAATGTGNVYKFIVGVVNTSNYIIKVADATDTIDGQVIVTNDATAGGTASVISWPTVAASDTITLNGTTTGGVGIGDYIELTDLIANQYVVSGMLKASGTEATPFSATVS
jgi:hypothetical protein